MAKPLGKPLTVKQQTFVAWCRANGLPKPEPELHFHPSRKWRFDWAWPDKMVALEQEGSVWVRGRHTRGDGYLKDLEKYNTATALGWKVLRVATASNSHHAAILYSEHCLAWLEIVLCER